MFAYDGTCLKSRPVLGLEALRRLTDQLKAIGGGNERKAAGFDREVTLFTVRRI